MKEFDEDLNKIFEAYNNDLNELIEGWKLRVGDVRIRQLFRDLMIREANARLSE